MSKVLVAFICDSNYVIPTAVAITSLVCNKNPDTYYDIYIIAAELSKDEIEKFYKFQESKVGIHIIRVSLAKFAAIPKIFQVTSTVCFKFDLPVLIPDQDKMLCLDSDVLIQKDLSDLFEININDYYAGVVKDFPLIDNDLNIKNYFNSGVMLLNLKLLRENDTCTALLGIRKSAPNLTFADQDCFNILFEKKVKSLPIKYNFFYNFFSKFRNKYTLDYINECFGTHYSSLESIKEESSIIHMIGYDKPWIYFDSFSAYEWDEYYRKSPFKLCKLKRKSIKVRDFIESHHILNVTYYFFQFWRDNGFKFAMDKAKSYFFNKKR
ncbi:MAG: glycosyltransferase family 8 protein [Syntrophaceae bacterium]|nr:glycosyltransferase family 8 protein [Syntrophaceae bacterium]